MPLCKSETVIGGRRCILFETERPLFSIIQPVSQHELSLIDEEVQYIIKETSVAFSLCSFLVDRWSRDLSPWPAPPVSGNESFGNGAAHTLHFIRQQLIPYLNTDSAHHLFLGGYSLSGLFSLWAGTQTDLFEGICAASPSVWFDGWIDYARQHFPQSKAIYLSLGDCEKKTRNRRLATVERCINDYNDILEGHVIHTLEWNTGNHFVNTSQRTARGFAWLLNKQNPNVREHTK